ncbi:MAG: hypothetical protein HFJ12_06850 [Bacilli bacterium]|nr:hypothetical protein [Bacilli bacterium]
MAVKITTFYIVFLKKYVIIISLLTNEVKKLKLKITNPRILSYILANAIILSQYGCNHYVRSKDINLNLIHRIEVEKEIEMESYDKIK